MACRPFSRPERTDAAIVSSVLLRRPQQVLPLAGPFLPQPRVQVDHQPLAGKVRAGDLRHRVGNQGLGDERRRLIRTGRTQELADVVGRQGPRSSRDPPA